MERKTNITARLVLLAAITYGVLTLVVLAGDIRDAQQEKDALVSELALVNKHISELSEGIAMQGDFRLTERIARDELGMIWRGEAVFCYNNP